MARADSTVWRSFERWGATAFLAAGVMFVFSAAVTLFDMIAGAEQLRLQLGQATVGAGWIAGLVGLLGLYAGLVERYRWLVRIGAAFAVIGLVGYAIMTGGVLAIFAGVPESSLEPLEPVFLPLMLAGSVLTFPLFGIACLRSDDHPSLVGVLLVAQTIVFLANALTPTPATVVFVVLIGLILVNFGVGYLLRTGSALSSQVQMESSHDSSAG